MREEELKDTTVMISLAIVIGASVVFVILLIAVVGLAFYRLEMDLNVSFIVHVDNAKWILGHTM